MSNPQGVSASEPNAYVTTTQPVGLYLPAATDANNSFVQASVTYLAAPVSYIGNIAVIPSSVSNTGAIVPSQVFVSGELIGSYPWSQYLNFGTAIAYYVEAPLSG